MFVTPFLVKRVIAFSIVETAPRLPSVCRNLGLKDWIPRETRFAKFAIIRAFFGVSVSGLHSTDNSADEEIWKEECIIEKSFLRCSAERNVGVPPPMKTLSSFPHSCDEYLKSRASFSRYESMVIGVGEGRE